jgi:coproporphyrinogen III oxidase
MNKEKATAFLKELQDAICACFLSLETSKTFQPTSWSYQKGEGGGQMRVLRGDVFEKAAVNFSAVSGKEFPMQDGSGAFFATGVSLITHMKNPKMPTAHMNIRYIETEKAAWIGGGYDLTPMGFPFPEDTAHFHLVAKNALDAFDISLYPLFSSQAKEYFYIPHRNKERGVGGIFFDHFRTDNSEYDFNLWKAIGLSFIDAIMPIYHRRQHEPFTSCDQSLQSQLRAHYVEFNLIYDRGTKFGFASGGNPEAILCSMPPLASW